MAFTKRTWQKRTRILDRIANIEDYLANGGGAAVNADDYKVGVEEEIGTYKGVPLYRYVVVKQTSNTSWTTVEALPASITTAYIVKIEAIVMNANGSSVMTPYYVSSSDMFRVGVEQGNLKAQLGSSYPTKPAYVFAYIYYTKQGV